MYEVNKPEDFSVFFTLKGTTAVKYDLFLNL